MERHGYGVCTPAAPDASQPTRPLIDLTSGYVARGIGRFPRQGSRTPWRLYQDYARDIELLRGGPIEDGAIGPSLAGPVRTG